MPLRNEIGLAFNRSSSPPMGAHPFCTLPSAIEFLNIIEPYLTDLTIFI